MFDSVLNTPLKINLYQIRKLDTFKPFFDKAWWCFNEMLVGYILSRDLFIVQIL